MFPRSSRLPAVLLALAAGGTSIAAEGLSPPRRRVEIVTSPRAAYEIAVEGIADFDNASTRRHDGWDIPFRTDVSLTIENVGTARVEDPKVIANGRGDWWTIDGILREALAGAEAPRDRALALWDFVRRNRYHDKPLFESRWGDELHDPVKYLAIYGAGFCDDTGSVLASLLARAGLAGEGRRTAPWVRCLHGHMMVEVPVGGNVWFLDADEDVFYLDRENEGLLGGDAVARDHDLARRERHYGPVFAGWVTGARAAALFGPDDTRTLRLVAGYEIHFALRPGERVEYRWAPARKWPAARPSIGRRIAANARFVLEPDLGRPDAFAERRRGITVAGGRARALAAEGRDGAFAIPVRTPFPICGGRVDAAFAGGAEDRFAMEIALDGTHFKRVWEGRGADARPVSLELDPHLGVKSGPPKYGYTLRIRLDSAAGRGSARLERLRISTEALVSPHFLPRLRRGRNLIVYTDATRGPRRVRVTHLWREFHGAPPPAPPRRPIAPADGAELRGRDTVAFRWPAAPGAIAYRIFVGLSPDARIPYRPSFDSVLADHRFENPHLGIFSPGVTYFWRVRARDARGIWGPWSPAWRFAWRGPRPPFGVRLERRGRGFDLVWGPNPRGPRPVAYEVYGSDERGFTPCPEPHTVLGLGRRPGNRLARTAATRLRVIRPDPASPRENRCFWRVVAIDGDGARSGPSDYAEAPHPLVLLPERVAVRPGAKVRIPVRVIRSLGDLQFRYESPHLQFWDIETPEVEILAGPVWLPLAGEGMLAGRAPAGLDRPVTVRVRATVEGRPPHEAETVIAPERTRADPKETGDERGRTRPSPPAPRPRDSADDADVARSRSPRGVLQIEGDALAHLEEVEVSLGDAGAVEEHVLPRLRPDEPEAALVHELPDRPFHTDS